MFKAFTESQLDQIIRDRFSRSLMSNSKWDKLLGNLTDAFPDGVRVRYKLIYLNDTLATHIVAPDFKPWFGEPTLYKEVEWIEFPSEYEDLADPNNRKAGMATFRQDTASIADKIKRIGIFETEKLPNSVRLYAYC